VPDHFAVAYNAPSFVTACSAGAYTYVGQPFTYGVAPTITVTAQNAANATTRLYTGAHWRITDTALASLGNRTYTAASGTLVTSAAPVPDPVIADAGAGTGTLAFGAGTGFYFDRTTPVAPFNAEVSLAINVVDADNVAYASNPARFGQAAPGSGIAYTVGNAMRYGRLMIGSANGSQLLPLRMPIETQYWNGASFVTNTADSCTAIAGASLGLSNYTQNLGATPACETSALIGGNFAAGRGSLRLAAPGSGNNGGVDVTVNLAGAPAGSACIAVGAPPVAPVSAGLPWLRAKGAGAAYDQNPKARARFGAYRASDEYIDLREVY
jgi:MSHA biogenesis protein MshQ